MASCRVPVSVGETSRLQCRSRGAGHIFVDHDLNSVDGEAESPKMDLPLPGFCGGFCHLDALTPCNMYDKYVWICDLFHRRYQVVKLLYIEWPACSPGRLWALVRDVKSLAPESRQFDTGGGQKHHRRSRLRFVSMSHSLTSSIRFGKTECSKSAGKQQSRLVLWNRSCVYALYTQNVCCYMRPKSRY